MTPVGTLAFSFLAVLTTIFLWRLAKCILWGTLLYLCLALDALFKLVAWCCRTAWHLRHAPVQVERQ